MPAPISHNPPDDLAERAAEMTQRGLMRHYGVSNTTVRSWLGLGPKPKRKPKPEVAERPIVPPHRRPHLGSVEARRNSRAVQQVTRHMRGPVRGVQGLDDSAADHLRRFTAVYRCDATGRRLSDGFFWRYGNAVLEPDELVARARRHGFDPDAWRRL